MFRMHGAQKFISGKDDLPINCLQVHCCTLIGKSWKVTYDHFSEATFFQIFGIIVRVRALDNYLSPF